MKDQEYYLNEIKHWCFKLHARKWWQPAIVEKIMIKHYVDKYLEAREEKMFDQLRLYQKKEVMD